MSDGSDSAARRAARAIDALRRGWPITVTEDSAGLSLLPIETGIADTALPSEGELQLMISASRADTLKLINQHAAADPELPVMISLPAPVTTAEITAIVDPVLDMQFPMKGPFRTLPINHPAQAKAAMALAVEAGLLPAFVRVEQSEDFVSVSDVAAFNNAQNLVISAQAKLPVATNIDAQIFGFRSAADAADHIALVVGKRDSSVPVVRLHSECLTGDMLGSLKMRLRPATTCSAGTNERNKLGRAALSTPGRPGHRPDQQAARLRVAGPGF